MLKKIVILVFVFLLAALSLLALSRSLKLQRDLTNNSQAKKNNLCRVGEKIVYDVKLGGLRLGKASFNNVSMIELNGKTVNLITFETRAARFTDLEKIYSDPDTFLPLRVERDISMWLKREKIVEEYDQENFTLTIKKLKHRKENPLLIKRQGPINNAILLPFYVRNMPKLFIGWSSDVRLPTQQFRIRLVSIEDLKIPAGTFNAYRFESIPKKFGIWISTDKRRIPLKIKGTNKLGYTLIMKEYSPED